ncbi:MAG TPA: SoxR reducing system RseC family protein [Thermodesulfovibrionales bacterium]|nr:SoxR reducing system RseC family protein [Thermodesulfovibrionales bacterium]
MKPTIPETGQVIKIEGERAVVILRGGEACKGCGAGEIGLCRSSGSFSVLSVKNTVGAVAGDSVKIGLDRSAHVKAFLLAFVLPCLAFLSGSVIGYVVGQRFSIPSLAEIFGFAFLAVSVFPSFKRLRKLDGASSLIISEIVADSTAAAVKTDEERRFEAFSATR